MAKNGKKNVKIPKLEGGAPLDKPARLTIVTDCETSAATPWERLQEK